MVVVVVQVALVVILVLITVFLVVQVVRSYTPGEFWRGVRDGLRRLGFVTLLFGAMTLAQVWIHAHIPVRDVFNYTSAVEMLGWIGGAINAHIWLKRQS